ncbi:MAG: glycine/betaine/sarcosine/D-proline family reductase selenoprotein B, partial [Proteobacteria bacterium]|nr:glycine/betaine/sarcosine/D-proline family reductase selenoprotein B [Pseudomonadota bacterium]
VNQFFGGVGAEEKANIPVEVKKGPIGPARLFQQLLGDGGTVEATIICGDNYFNEQREQALADITQAWQEAKPDLVVAGPAFDAGRYGLACGAVCAAAQEMGIPAITAMHPENPGVLTYRRQVVIVPTGTSPVDLQDILANMHRLARKLASGEELGPAQVEGYLGRGVRRVTEREAPGYKRAVDMLADKLNGRPFQSEVPFLTPEAVIPAPPVADLKQATIALISTGGLIPMCHPLPLNVVEIDLELDEQACQVRIEAVAKTEAKTGVEMEAMVEGYLAFARSQDTEVAVETDLPLLLDVDVVTLGFEPSAGPVPVAAVFSTAAHRIGKGTVDKLLGTDNNVRLLREIKDDGTIFGSAAGLARSAALARLRPGNNIPAGFMALGSRGAAFGPGQGTELIGFLARVMEACIFRLVEHES